MTRTKKTILPTSGRDDQWSASSYLEAFWPALAVKIEAETESSDKIFLRSTSVVSLSTKLTQHFDLIAAIMMIRSTEVFIAAVYIGGQRQRKLSSLVCRAGFFVSRWFSGDSITGLSLITISLNLFLFFLIQRVSFETQDHKSWSIGCVAFLFLAWLVTRPDRMFFHLSLLKMTRNNGSILIGWYWYEINKVWLG